MKNLIIKMLLLPRKFIIKIVTHIILNRKDKKGLLIFYDNPKFNKDFDLIKKIRKETEMLFSDVSAHKILEMIKKTEKINGDIAEVGVYRGGSAKIICENTKKLVYLFDTFEGLPDLSDNDEQNHFNKGDYKSSFEGVKEYLKKYPNVNIYKGFFPVTADPIKGKKFSFVHLDVDIYESTLNCLEFFYQRMNKGGVIISHDYLSSLGVKKAIDDFFVDKPEIVIELLVCNQCIIVKV